MRGASLATPDHMFHSVSQCLSVLFDALGASPWLCPCCCFIIISVSQFMFRCLLCPGSKNTSLSAPPLFCHATDVISEI